MARQALGKGLDALISGAAKEKQKGIMTIEIENIKSNIMQPRKTFNPEKLDELIKSIKEKGVIQPVIVKELEEGKYELIAGERRFRAAERAGLRSIPAVVKNVSPVEQLEIALIENIQREDLNPVEESQAYKQLMEGYRLTQEELADKLGKNRATVTNILRLLKLPSEIQRYLVTGEISTGHAKVLLGIEEASKQKAYSEQVVKKSLSVRELENLIKKESRKRPAKIKPVMPEIKTIEDNLKLKFGTKARIKGSYKKGKIEIEYYNKEDFERIMELLLGI
jgi:ParB family chromosome partitioning protein